MRKVSAMLVAVAAAVSTTADLTQFRWSGGAAGSVPAGYYVHTFLDSNTTRDMLAYVIGGSFDFADLLLFSPYNSQEVVITSVGPTAGQWGTGSISGNGAIAGKYAYAVVTQASSWEGIQVGDTFKIFSIAGPIYDLQPDLKQPPAAPQSFSPGSFITIPEPATALLLGIGGAGTWLLRRSKMKPKEEQSA